MATQSVKDILGTEIPSPSWVWSPTKASPLPPDTVGFSRSSVAFTREYPTIGYSSRSAGTPRISQGDSFLMEQEQTNFVLSSSDISQNSSAFGSSGNVSLSDPAREIINSPDADSKFIESGGSANDRYRMDASGTYSGGVEVVSVLAGRGSSGKLRGLVTGTTVEVDFDAETHNILRDEFGAIKSVNKRFFLNPRTGNNRICQLVISLDTSVFDSTQDRYLDVGPSSSTAGENVIHYHSQIETGNLSSPIVTSGSKKSRAREGLTVEPKEWWNESGGTFFAEVIPQSFRFGFGAQKLIRAPVKEWLNITSSPSPFSIASYDGSLGIAHSNSTLDAFEPGRIAVSFTSSERRLALNGVAETFSHNGDLLAKPSTIKIGDNGKAQVRIKRISYFPDALTKSQLETLTA